MRWRETGRRGPPRYVRFLAAEKNATVRVDAVDKDVVTIGVYLQTRGFITGINGEVSLKDGKLSFHPFDGSGDIVKDVVGVHATVETGEQLRSRTTLARMLLVGPFAFALKKHSGGERFFTVEGPDFVWAVEVGIDQANEAVEFATLVNNEAKSRTSAKITTPRSSQPDIIDRLERLANLKAEGALTDEEFTAAKRIILNLG